MGLSLLFVVLIDRLLERQTRLLQIRIYLQVLVSCQLLVGFDDLLEDLMSQLLRENIIASPVRLNFLVHYVAEDGKML